ncbi:MAG: class I tRNA ligase family protein, partial [Actinomycetota bacterium]|nr:class I tRNA ligase family protein [Actinomycetota bacterium]
VLRNRNELRWPADLYVEGSDQHRGWFQSSLLLSIGYCKKPPYHAVLTHGFTVDGQGRKMSKSLGNVVDPLEVYDKMGADILRLWASMMDYSSDIPISEEILSRTVEAYRRIRNTIRFLLGNLYDFNPEVDGVPYEKMEEIDKLMLSRLERLVEQVTASMENYLFHQAIQSIHLFCTVDLSSLYLDVLKDRLYTFPSNSCGRKSAQTVLGIILEKLVLMLSPIIVHTADEAWLQIPWRKNEISVHLSDWPSCDRTKINPALEEKWETLMNIRENAYRSIEEERQKGLLGTSLEAKVSIFAEQGELVMLRSMERELKELLIVSQVELRELDDFNARRSENSIFEIIIEKADGNKCERCWNFDLSVGSDERYPQICKRCILALGESKR